MLDLFLMIFVSFYLFGNNNVLFRYFVFASMCYSLLPIMLNIFDVICQLADDFYEKKNIYTGIFFTF